jgi:hypothetical protein
MDAEEIKKKLRESGIPIGGWTQTEAKSGVRIPLVERQAVALKKIESILESQMQKDQQQLAELHAMLQKLKHGGGTGHGG